MITEIKTIVKNYLDNSLLCKLMTGDVVSVSPLSIKLSDNLTIPASTIHVPTWLKAKNSGSSTHAHVTQIADGHTHEVDASGAHVHQIFYNLKAGDKVMILRDSGGQKYFILDVISS